MRFCRHRGTANMCKDEFGERVSRPMHTLSGIWTSGRSDCHNSSAGGVWHLLPPHRLLRIPRHERHRHPPHKTHANTWHVGIHRHLLGRLQVGSSFLPRLMIYLSWASPEQSTVIANVLYWKGTKSQRMLACESKCNGKCNLP